MSDSRCLVAMSGGVDSSVAALMLKQQGKDLIGVSMQVWDYRKNGGCESKASCCSPRDFEDARLAASRLDIPWYVFDMEKEFQQAVIDRFVTAYSQGLTPNPCIDCNNLVKFGELRRRAASLGCSHVATGHYATITDDAAGFHLLRGSDSAKDQSYFLYGLTQEELSQTLFPLGQMNKSEVRELARQSGLPTADKPESQDICFVQGSLQSFLKRQGLQENKGNIIDKAGNKIGEHAGVQNFTVGQRKGLRVGGSDEPLYVLELDAAQNLVKIGNKSELERTGFAVEDLSFVSPALLAQLNDTAFPMNFEAVAQVRYRHAGIRVSVSLISPKHARVNFHDSWTAVAPTLPAPTTVILLTMYQFE